MSFIHTPSDDEIYNLPIDTVRIAVGSDTLKDIGATTSDMHASSNGTTPQTVRLRIGSHQTETHHTLSTTEVVAGDSIRDTRGHGAGARAYTSVSRWFISLAVRAFDTFQASHHTTLGAECTAAMRSVAVAKNADVEEYAPLFAWFPCSLEAALQAERRRRGLAFAHMVATHRAAAPDASERLRAARDALCETKATLERLLSDIDRRMPHIPGALGIAPSEAEAAAIRSTLWNATMALREERYGNAVAAAETEVRNFNALMEGVRTLGRWSSRQAVESSVAITKHYLSTMSFVRGDLRSRVRDMVAKTVANIGDWEALLCRIRSLATESQTPHLDALITVATIKTTAAKNAMDVVSESIRDVIPGASIDVRALLSADAYGRDTLVGLSGVVEDMEKTLTIDGSPPGWFAPVREAMAASLITINRLREQWAAEVTPRLRRDLAATSAFTEGIGTVRTKTQNTYQADLACLAARWHQMRGAAEVAILTSEERIGVDAIALLNCLSARTSAVAGAGRAFFGAFETFRTLQYESEYTRLVLDVVREVSGVTSDAIDSAYDGIVRSMRDTQDPPAPPSSYTQNTSPGSGAASSTASSPVGIGDARWQVLQMSPGGQQTVGGAALNRPSSTKC